VKLHDRCPQSKIIIETAQHIDPDIKTVDVEFWKFFMKEPV
jgi:hypothetical protein